MKKNLRLTTMTVLLALMPALFPTAAWTAEEAAPAEPKQEEEKVTGEAAAGILSAYIWRGQELTRHAAVIQPSITANYKGASVNVWGNLDTKPYAADNRDYASNYTETDLTLSYSRKFGIVQATAGYIYYGLAAAAPGGPDLPDAQELFVSLGLDAMLAPTLTVYKEIDHYHQWYATLGISHTFALHEKAGLKLAGSVSYLKSEDETTYPAFDGDSLATADKFNNFHDGVLALSLPVNAAKNLTVTPTMAYVFPLSSDAKYEMKARGLEGTEKPSDRDCAYLYGGLTLSFTF